LHLRAQAIAAFLGGRVAAGDRVLLAFDDQFEFAEGFLGCAYAGVVGVPVPVPWSAKNDKGRLARIAGIVSDCAPVLALSTDRVAENVWPFAASFGIALPCISIDGIEAGGAAGFEPRVPAKNDLFYLQYTSGSTGAPRGVRVSHGNVVSNLHGMREVSNLDTSSPFVSWLPHYHDMGLVVMMMHPLYFGGTTYLMSPTTFIKRPARWLEAISRYRAGMSGGPNFAYDTCVRRIAPESIPSLDLSSWTCASISAEPISEATILRFTRTFEPAGFSRFAWNPAYGLAESTVFVSGYRSGRGYRVLETESGARAISCGRAPSDTSLWIVDPQTREPVADGTQGEILVAGPSVSAGYWGDAKVSEFLATGDIGAIVDGELFVLGRLKDIVIINGTNHHAADLEATIASSVEESLPERCAVFGADIDGVERLIAAIEIETFAPGHHVELLGAVRKAVADRHDITVFDLVVLRPGQLPRTSSGKIRRNVCRERYLVGELC
jgi:acyl-CoA synthetase (AMP-forming)/AMP-acid ligase II